MKNKLYLQDFISYGGLRNFSIHCVMSNINGEIKIKYRYDFVGKELQPKFLGNYLLGLGKKRYTRIGIMKALDKLGFKGGYKQYDVGDKVSSNGIEYIVKKNCGCHIHHSDGTIHKADIEVYLDY